MFCLCNEICCLSDRLSVETDPCTDESAAPWFASVPSPAPHHLRYPPYPWLCLYCPGNQLPSCRWRLRLGQRAPHQRQLLRLAKLWLQPHLQAQPLSAPPPPWCAIGSRRRCRRGRRQRRWRGPALAYKRYLTRSLEPGARAQVLPPPSPGLAARTR